MVKKVAALLADRQCAGYLYHADRGLAVSAAANFSSVLKMLEECAKGLRINNLAF